MRVSGFGCSLPIRAGAVVVSLSVYRRRVRRRLSGEFKASRFTESEPVTPMPVELRHVAVIQSLWNGQLVTVLLPERMLVGPDRFGGDLAMKRDLGIGRCSSSVSSDIAHITQRRHQIVDSLIGRPSGEKSFFDHQRR